MARARACAGPLLRVLSLAVVLFAFALTHGAITDSAGGHLVTSTATPATAVAEHALHGVDAPSAVTLADRFTGPREGHGDHMPSHPAEHCASAQPQQGPAFAQPRFAASVSEVVTPGCARTVREAGESLMSDQSSAALRSLIVQQI